MIISLLTGGGEKHYQLGLISGLAKQDIIIEVIGSDKMAGSEELNKRNIRFINLRGDQNYNSNLFEKTLRIVKYYLKLFSYAARTDSKLFHIQWLNKFDFFDRTLLTLFYKIMGKKLVFTVHDVDKNKIVTGDYFTNKGNNHYKGYLSTKLMYNLVDCLIVHNNRVKKEIIENYHISGEKIITIPHGINTLGLTNDIFSADARNKLNIPLNKKVILFFGNIAANKGLELLLDCFNDLIESDDSYFLIIAGAPRINQDVYIADIVQRINKVKKESILSNLTYIPDEDIKYYLMSADCLALPYKFVYQSGVTYLAYSFGLPVIATDVGNFREEIVVGETGFISKSNTKESFKLTIDEYFNSDLFNDINKTRISIREYAIKNYSWDKIAQTHLSTYNKLQNSNN
jgi:glycosyltransferase involved in cell wall biosynthesis